MKSDNKDNEKSHHRFRALALTFVLFLYAFAGVLFLSGDSFAAGEPTVEILHPMEGQTVYSSEMVLKLDVQNFILNETAVGEPNVPGEGHYHVYINDVPMGFFAVKNLTLDDLPEGDHNLRVELRNNDHSHLEPSVMDEVNFTIKYPSVKITEPMEGEISYGGMLDYMVEVENFTLNGSAIGDEKMNGEGHYHLYVNDGLIGPYTDLHRRLSDLPAGDHTLKVELRNNDHTPLIPEVYNMVNFTIVEEHPMIMIKEPMDGAIGYGGEFMFKLDVMNFTLNGSAIGMDKVPGEGHYHLYINDALIGPSADMMRTLEDLPAGDHVLKVELRNNDHSQLKPDPIMDSMEFTIVEEMPSIEITMIEDGSVGYGGMLKFGVSVESFTLNGSAIGGEKVPGEGHYHLYVNDGLIGPSVDLMRTLYDLPEGEHVLKVELRHNDHSPLIPPVEDHVMFMIRETQPMIEITSPMNGSVIYWDSLDLEVMVHNFTLNGSAIGMDNMPGEGHYHVYLNDDLVGPYSDSMIELSDLPAGMHHLKVELRNNDHSPLIADTDMISDSIWFTISEDRPMIMIEDPMDGSIIYDDTLHLKVMADNFTMNSSAIGGDTVVGEGHYHIYINGDLMGPYTDMMVNLTDLPAGMHELKVELRNNDHSMIYGNSSQLMDSIYFWIVDSDPSISISKPTDGAWFYGSDLEVMVDIDDLMMNSSAIGGNKTPGEGHWHLYINGDLIGPYTEDMVMLSDLPAGHHELKVMLVNNDHTPIMPEAMAMVEFHLLPVPSIEIVSPQNDTTIDRSSLDLVVEVEDFSLNSSAIGGDNMPGEGHYHIYINDELVGPYTDLEVTLSDLPAGVHTLKVELKNNDHSALGVEAMDMIYFTILGEETDVTVNFGPVLKDGDPLAGAEVALIIGGETYTATTDEEGIAEFTLPVSLKGEQFEYAITKDGYEDLEGTGTLENDGSLSGLGELEVEEEEDDNSTIYLILVIGAVVVIAILLLIVLGSRKSEKDFEE